MTDQVAKLGVEHPAHQPAADWLIKPLTFRASVARSTDGKEIVLTNGLIRRAFRVEPNAATVAFDNTMTGASMLRAVKPEAILKIDGHTYPVGRRSASPGSEYGIPLTCPGRRRG